MEREQDTFLLRGQDYFISPANTLAVERRYKQSVFPIHDHDFEELVIVSEGSGLHIWNDVPYPITCGDVFYIAAADQHGYQSVNNLKLDNILYDRQKFAILMAISPYLPVFNAPESERYWQINSVCLNQICSLLDELASECKKPDKASIILSEALFLQLVVILYRFRHHPDSQELTPNHQIDMLLTALHGSISIPFNIEQFCLQLQIAPRTLRRHFKTKTGMTISDYLQQLRLCRAMSLLRDPTRAISLVAADCGYDDSNYFSSVFRKLTGETPSQYRERFTIKKSVK